jgi:FkbM family methyltransferase
MKHGDFLSILASLRYLVNKKSHSSDRIIQTSTGRYYCRKNTNDFQFANYAYEWGVKKYMLDNLDSFSVFIDGGACIGDYCILFSRHNIRCIAFEPVIDNFRVLTRNLELNNLEKTVLAFPYGLGAVNETANFIFNPVNTGASRLAGTDQKNDFAVEIRTLDSMLPILDIASSDRILIKLDVEGMEPQAIRGAKNFITQFPYLTFVIEDKHIGDESIKSALNDLAVFEYGVVDEFNIFAKKIKNHI